MKAYLSRRLRRLIEAVFVTAALCTTALVAACGGGSGGGGDGSLPAPPPATRSALYMTDFGVAPGQLAATAASRNMVFSMDWGNWATDRLAIEGRIIADLQEARARGIHHAIVAVGFLVFDAHYRPLPDLGALAAFRTQLQALDLLSMVDALYPVDEPELHGLSTDTLLPVLHAIRAAWPATPLAVIYGDTRNYAALAGYDWVGKDKYGDGAGVLTQLPPLTAGQQWLVVPGGASPWQNAIQPFYDFAQAHPEVIAIVSFIWPDHWGGTTNLGLQSNGMAASYAVVGTAIKERYP